MKRYGCIGKTLKHSFSKEIHALLADYEYELIELDEREIDGFFKKRDFAAINVTIPYKRTVMAYMDEVSAIAWRIGAVNTIVNREGRLCGYNTDYYGMKALIERVGVDMAGKKVLVLGTGGTSRTARVVAEDMGAAQVLTVSRSEKPGSITYEAAILRHSDAQVIINTTPSGMYPDCDECPIEVEDFPQLVGVIDAVYNPLRTNLVLDAQERGIPAEGGLYMLVMQAVYAVEHFLDVKIPKATADAVFAKIHASKENIVLTGMPGCGKSTVGNLIEAEGLDFMDTDALIVSGCGREIKHIIEEKGIAYFRDLESDVVHAASMKSGLILSTGGGAILREENVRCLKRNGRLYFLNASLKRLKATDDRPLSDTDEKLAKLYGERMGIYTETADVIVPEMDTPEQEAAYILQKRRELIK